MIRKLNFWLLTSLTPRFSSQGEPSTPRTCLRLNACGASLWLCTHTPLPVTCLLALAEKELRSVCKLSWETVFHGQPARPLRLQAQLCESLGWGDRQVPALCTLSHSQEWVLVEKRAVVSVAEPVTHPPAQMKATACFLSDGSRFARQ